jgi:predicted metal-dependent phosphoesterase TrpH
MPIDVSVLVAAAMRQDGHSIGRPQVARAMVDARHVADTREAFDRWLGFGKPAFVPRTGAAPARVIEIIHAAGGLASLAHPGQTGIDDHLPALRDAGLDALEVFHPDHPPDATERYRRLASDLELLVTGGSDFHGDPAHGLEPGAVTLPADDWRRLLAARRAV